MSKHVITLVRTQRTSFNIEIEAPSLEEALEKAQQTAQQLTDIENKHTPNADIEVSVFID